MPGAFHIKASLQERAQPFPEFGLAKIAEESHGLRVIGRAPQGCIYRLPLQQRLLPLIQQLEAGVNRCFCRMMAQNFGAQAVDGADARSIQPRSALLPVGALSCCKFGCFQVTPHSFTDTIAHLTGGFPGVGDGDRGA
ncbi:MAG: hypothetical protein BWY25_02374 [Chloroflexi bacterium ADurb.Bin222]|nr:MAG: hypothetical protein BWY25_02374 [Chloroflexi bacterium ADurb.Bin222]